MPELIQVKRHQASGTIILNRAEKRNALSRQLLAELHQAFSDLHQEKQVRAVILTGAGSAFCAGMDLGEMQATALQDNAQQQYVDDAVQYQELVETMLRFPKPILAAVNGPAIAGGLGLMLAADVVIAAPEALFGVPEPKRGIVAGLVAPLLTFRIGGGQAARLLLTAATIPAAEAHRIGLVHELVAGEMVWARAHELATEISVSAPQSLQLTKRLLNEAIGEQLFTLLVSGASASATARTTAAAEEGLAAFLEKRAPKWP
jgi:enoyl-CoA hydratase/carnithine racemase